MVKLKLVLIPSLGAGRNQKDKTLKVVLEGAGRSVEVREIKVNQYTLHRM